MSPDTPDTPATTPRARRRLARRRAILDAAMDILVQEGLDGLTIQRLAQALDYTPGAFYRYFASKDVIFAELQVRTFSQLARVYQEAWARYDAHAETVGAGEDVRVLGRLVMAAYIYTQLPRTRPTWFGLIQLSVGQPNRILAEEHAAPVLEATMALLGGFAEQIQQAEQRLGLRLRMTPLRAAIAIWSSLHGVCLTRKFAYYDAELFESERLGLDVALGLLRGCGADARALQQALEHTRALDAERPLVPPREDDDDDEADD